MADRKFFIKLAYRNMASKKMRTILTLAGVIVGISAIVFLLAFAFGLERLVTQEVTQGDALRLIDVGTGNSKVVKLNDQAVDSIKNLPNTQQVEITINVGAKARKNGDKSVDATMYGTTPTYIDWSGARIRYGKNLDKSRKDQVLVNESYAEFLDVGDPSQAIGRKERFDLILTKELTDDNKSVVEENVEYEIVGVVQNESGPTLYTNYINLVDIGATKYSQLKVEMKTRANVTELRMQIENLGFKTEYIGDTIGQIEQIFGIFKLILGSFGLIALIVASLGMFNTLTISLMERMREIALLKILGAQRRMVMWIFLLESIIFGFLGGVIGILFGFLSGFIANFVLNYYAQISGAEKVNIFYYSPWMIVSVLIFSITIGVITGIYPSRRAAKVSALDVLRYE